MLRLFLDINCNPTCFWKSFELIGAWDNAQSIVSRMHPETMDLRDLGGALSLICEVRVL